jgi:hypothetical protein
MKANRTSDSGAPTRNDVPLLNAAAWFLLSLLNPTGFRLGAAVDTMMQVVGRTTVSASDYFRLKAKLLGVRNSLCTINTRW